MRIHMHTYIEHTRARAHIYTHTRTHTHIFCRECMRTCVSKIKDKILGANSSHQNIKKVHINISTNLLRYNSKY